MKKRLLILVLFILCFTLVAFNGCVETPETYTVTFVTNGGSAVSAVTVKDGDTLSTVATPTKDGYKFDGWFTDSECTQPFKITTQIHEDTTLYAGWTSKSSYTVTFVTNGGSAIDAITVEEGDTLSLNVSTSKENYAFVGWYTDVSLTHEFADGTAIDDDAVLYAKWQRTHYSVTVKVMSTTKVVKVAVGDKLDLGAIDLYDKVLYICMGWEDANGATYGANDIIDVNADMMLEGQFRGVDFLFTLDPTGSYYIIESILDYTDSELVIPEIYNNLPIKEIRYLGMNDSITSLYIPDTIEVIGEAAFRGLSAIQSINAPFLGGSLITSLPTTDEDSSGKNLVFGYWFNESDSPTHPMGYRSIPSRYYELFIDLDTNEIFKAAINTYFLYPESLQTVTIRGGVIPNIAFYNVTTIEKLILGDDVTAIGSYAFANDYTIVEEEHKFSTVEFGADSKLQSFGENTFRGNFSIKEITIPKGVTEIPYQMFYNCVALETVRFAEGNQLTVIGEQAFFVSDLDAKASLVNITFPETLQTIGLYAFMNSNALKTITIPASVTDLGAAVFEYATSLESVTFASGSTITKLPSSIFRECHALAEVNLPDVMNVIGDNAFTGCGSLKEDQFDFTKINEIGRFAFASTGFEHVVLPANVTKLGAAAFALCDELVTVVFDCAYNENFDMSSMFDDCENLKSVVFPQGITEISTFMFRNCTNYEVVEIPATVVRICDNAFGGMVGNLTTVTFEAGSVLQEIGRDAFWGRDKLTSISLPSTITKIGANAFAFCYNLTTVQIADGAQNLTIGNYAFNRCFRLASVNLDGTVSIGDGAFNDCISLATVAIPSTVEKVGSNAFARNADGKLYNHLNGTGLTVADMVELTISVDLPLSTVIDKEWANSWSGDANLEYSDGSKTSTFDDTWVGLLDNVSQTITVTKYVGNDTVLVLPETINYNGREYNVIWTHGVFSGNRTLTKVTMSVAMTEIPNEFFKGCESLVEVVIPAHSAITRIGNGAFEFAINDDPSFTTLTVGDGVNITVIGDYAFCYVSKLQNLGINFANVTSIGDYAFRGVGNTWTEDITLTSALTSIGEYAFYQCKKITIYFNGALDNLTEIPTAAFSSCKIFVGADGVLTIPSNIVSIGDYAFQLAREGNVRTLVIDANNDLSIGNYAFASFSFYRDNTVTDSYYQRLYYILIKGTPKYLGRMFASSNYSGTSSSSKVPMYFEDVVFESNNRGVVTGYPEAWDSTWHYMYQNEDTGNITYMPVYAKGTWHYSANGTPVVGAE